MAKVGNFTIALIAIYVLSQSCAFAGGIDVPNQGARASGQAEAFIAQANDPSAVFYNPAGLSQLRGTNITGGAYLIIPEWSFQGAAGEQEMRLPSVLSHLYVESDFGLPRWRFAFGVNDVFGLHEDWGGGDRPLSSIVEKAHVYVFNFQPTITFALNEHLSIGTGFNIYYGDLMLNRMQVVAAPPAPEAEFELNGHGTSYGATPALLWRIDNRNVVGLRYRSGFTMDFEGGASLTGAGVAVGPTRTVTHLAFPQEVGIGYALWPKADLKVEVDGVWDNWSVVQNTTVHSSSPVFNGTTTPERWRDTYSIRLGGEYHLGGGWAIRAGYAYGQGSVPAATFSPIVPDSNYHLFTAGLGYSVGDWAVDLAYQYALREDRNIDKNFYGTEVEGKWENRINAVMVTVSYRL